MPRIDLDELTNSVWRTGDFEEYKRAMEETFKSDPISMSKESLSKSSDLLRGFVDILLKTSFARQPYFQNVFDSALNLVLEPATRNLQGYLSFLEDVKKDTVFDLE